MEIIRRTMITRPAHQAGKLANGIAEMGGASFLFPTIEILPSELSIEDKDKIKHINQFDIIVFISPNAVEHGLTQIQAITDLPSSSQIATIGQGSANALTKLGVRTDICPKENFNSEGLLATDAMQNVSNKKVLIIRGNAGREELKQTLEKRGAAVEYLEVYKRIKPAADSCELEQYLQNNEIAVIVITSAESLKNLVELTPKHVLSDLFQIPLLLINNRLVEVARKAGFSNELIVTTESSDEAIIGTLKQNNFIKPMRQL